MILDAQQLDLIERRAQANAGPAPEEHDADAEARAAMESTPPSPLREHGDARKVYADLRAGTAQLFEVALDRVEDLLAAYRREAEMAMRAGRPLPDASSVVGEAIGVASLAVRARGTD